LGDWLRQNEPARDDSLKSHSTQYGRTQDTYAGEPTYRLS